jgi:O-antigen ligase
MRGILAGTTVLTAFADRLLPTLLPLLLVALPTSITAIDTLLVVLVLVLAVRAFDPALRARDRFPLAAPILAFAAVTLASALLSDAPGPALWRAHHLFSFALFLAAVNGFRDGAHARRALRWLFAAVAVASVHAIVQWWACSSSVPLPSWAGWLLRVDLATCRTRDLPRAKGFFSIYMTLAGSLSAALALMLGALVLGGRRARPLLAPAALGFVALGLTLVRSAWLGCAGAIGLLVLLTRRLALILPIVLALVVGLGVPSSFHKRFVKAFDPHDASATERLYFWHAGLRMVADAPLLGLGPGGVGRHYADYKHPDGVRRHTGHLHNNLVQIAAERGLLGLAAWLWIWVAFFLRAARIYRALPPARGDDRALVAGSLAAVTGFLVAGLLEYNFGDSEVIDLVLVAMALPFVAGATGTPRPPTGRSG